MNGYHKIQMPNRQISEVPWFQKCIWGAYFEEYALVSNLPYVERETRKFLKLLSAVQLPSCNITDLANSEKNTSRELDQDRFSQHDIG